MAKIPNIVPITDLRNLGDVRAERAWTHLKKMEVSSKKSWPCRQKVAKGMAHGA
jgi:hypothetical protein